MTRNRPILRTAAVAASLALAIAAPARGHQRDPADEVLRKVGVDERPGAAVPADLTFRDPGGASVRLVGLLAGGPAILTLNYYTCPMLCPLTLKSLLGTVEGVRGLSLAKDFRIVTVSIDPGEREETARARAREMHAQLRGVPDPGARWPFLRGGGEEIRRLAEATGIRYAKVGTEFAHPTVAVVLTPDGRISRYLYGMDVDPRDLKLALLEAAGGRIGESQLMNRILLACYHYDPAGRTYVFYATNLMRVGGAVTIVLLGGFLFILWRRDRAGRASGRGAE